MKYWYDTEFLENGVTIELISIGIVAEDGREYYAVRSDAPWDRVLRHDWLMKNVVPSLPGLPPKPGITPGITWTWQLDRSDARVKPKFVIANEVRDFLLADNEPELWAYYGAYDHVALCQLWGPMVSLPKGLPFRTRELMELWESYGKPVKPDQVGEHNALEDAKWNRELYYVCREHYGARD